LKIKKQNPSTFFLDFQKSGNQKKQAHLAYLKGVSSHLTGIILLNFFPGTPGMFFFFFDEGLKKNTFS
jgi:hypothetical protein